MIGPSPADYTRTFEDMDIVISCNSDCLPTSVVVSIHARENKLRSVRSLYCPVLPKKDKFKQQTIPAGCGRSSSAAALFTKSIESINYNQSPLAKQSDRTLHEAFSEERVLLGVLKLKPQNLKISKWTFHVFQTKLKMGIFPSENACDRYFSGGGP